MKSTQTRYAAVALNRELNTHQARRMRQMPPFLTPGDSVMDYFWNHLTTLVLNRCLNAHLQHLLQLLTPEKKKESNYNVKMCSLLRRHSGSQGREGLTAVETMLRWKRGKSWFRMKAYEPSSAHWVWVGPKGLRGSEEVYDSAGGACRT